MFSRSLSLYYKRVAKRNIVEDFGGVGQTIVLLHGFVADKTYWKKLQPRLTRAGYRVVTLDLLGFGVAKKRQASDYNYDEHIAHIHEQIETLHLKEPFVLAGHSMGALLATRYTQKYPDNIKQLFLLHPPLYRDREEVQTTLHSTGRAYRFLLTSHFREFGWRLMQLIPKVPIGSHTQQSREGSMHSVIESAEFMQDLHKVRTKTLLLIGAKDRPEYIRNIATADIANKNIDIIIEDLSHHSPLYNSRFVADVITKVLTINS